MLKYPYKEKSLSLVYVIICHFLVNDTGGREGVKMIKFDMEKRDCKKCRFASDALFE